jgi:hypothetical protein
MIHAADIAHVVRGDVMLSELVVCPECAPTGNTAVVDCFLMLVQVFPSGKVRLVGTSKAGVVVGRIKNVLPLS